MYRKRGIIISKKLGEIKEYFNKQTDWSTVTEYNYVKWLIETLEKAEEEVEKLKSDKEFHSIHKMVDNLNLDGDAFGKSLMDIYKESK